MPHYRSLDKLSLEGAWLTVGVFDGVHRGHQELLRQLVEGAHAAHSPAVVLTFDPHPAVLLGGKAEFKSLTTPEERFELLETLGVDTVITQTFDRALADQTAEEFMQRAVRALGLQRLVVGYDTALGRGRQGDAKRLTEIGQELGFTVQVIPALTESGEVISSTHIRRLIAAGEVAEAAARLGREYSLKGPVIHGDGRGRHINIPTANIQPPDAKAIPANGVYACWAWTHEEVHPAVTNIGIRPTFTPQEFKSHVEAHLLGFDRELYDQEVKLEFVERLRPEQKFPSIEALIAQIHADIDRANEILV
ncbi:MAG: bifunctional riboflavin kinase/FAD synthetase [Anaerolineales bacterium]|jgi:riboflavin kinase/FMN adenylyltransferase